MHTHKQRGSTHLVLVVILVLALLGALGFIFWQNFVQKNGTNVNQNESVSQTTKTIETVKLKTVAFNPAFGARLGFSYPENWSLERSIEGPIPLDGEKGITSETITVTSPSKNIYVKYQLGANGGLGGMCLPEESGIISVLRQTPLANFSGNSFSENIAHRDGGYRYFSGIMSDSSLNNAKVGGSECALAYAEVIRLSEKDNITLMGASIHIKGLEKNYDGATKDPAELSIIENKFQDDEYKQAKTVILSTESIQ